MGGFDIESLLQFAPPRYFCQNCRALYVKLPIDFQRDLVVCNVCNAEYAASETIPIWEAEKYFVSEKLTIQFKDTIGHSRTLAQIARNMRTGKRNYSPYVPMQGLLEALASAQQFVHFATYGMSLQLIGALRMAALQADVSGIVSNVGQPVLDELQQYSNESPRMTTQLFQRSEKRGDWETMPHQKVIVIDGLLAFKGSANLTVDGWRKAARGLDSVEVVTDVSEVIALNNKLFSPIWARESIGAKYTMPNSDEVPF